MDRAEFTEQFVRQLTAHQSQLFGYVHSLLGDRHRAAEVVQETNLVLWRKLDEFQPERPFLPWAFAIARYQVLAHLRDRQRDKLLLDAELVESLSDEASRRAEELDELRQALRPCLQQLTDRNRELIEQRYLQDAPMARIAESMGRSKEAIKVALMRVRRQLSECVQRRLAAES